MWHLSAPRSAVCARDSGLSARAEWEVFDRRFPGFRGSSPRHLVGLEGPATSSPSTPLCAAQARPARTFGHQKQVGGPDPSASPVSPEGDHFPRTPMVKVHVVPSPPAPAPPRQDASWCIRGGTGEVWAQVWARGMRFFRLRRYPQRLVAVDNGSTTPPTSVG